MSSTFDRHVHPVLACAETIGTALKETVAVQVTSWTRRTSGRRGELTRLEAQLSALKLRVMAVADDVALAEGARDVGALLTHETHTDFGANRRDLALAQALDRRWAHVADALARGELERGAGRGDHPRAGGAADREGHADLLARAEAHLVAEAAHFGPRELRVLGRRVLEILAPEIFEQHEAEQLAEEERRARRRTAWSPRVWVTAPPGSPSTSRTRRPPDCTPTSRRSPRPGTEGGRGRPDPGRPQARPGVLLRCSRPSTPSGCRSMAGMPPR